ncbi:prenyltransferase/squalene oxidase repeat-containing protein [Nocardia sp. NPDC051052]|uniref:prenyltransferase/squalene oxidase repeat-containing protein n=1 Tax=Nocardia sp. NPDC051052 TaxID=3364322 RepID=UPI0037B3F1EB
MPLDNAEATRRTSYLFTSQNRYGGFGEAPGLPSELFTTYCVAPATYFLNRRDFDIERCHKFLRRCRHPHGGFGNFPGYHAVATLYLLDVEPADGMLRLVGPPPEP